MIYAPTSLLAWRGFTIHADGHAGAIGLVAHGQAREVEPLSHGERVNVPGALSHDGKLHWKTQRRPTVRGDDVRFFDELTAQHHTVPRIVVLDNASIHKGGQIEVRRKEWVAQSLFLYYLPPYSPELNGIEMVWKQAKYF